MKKLNRVMERIIPATLVFLVTKKNVLLGIKYRKIGANLWNGYGGKIEIGETARQAASRELEKEVFISVPPDKLIKMAEIDFHNYRPSGSSFIFRVHIYFASKWMGRPRETKEMKSPTWWKKDKLPIWKMMPADRIWLPMTLAGKKIKAEFWYTPGQRALKNNYRIKEVNFFKNNE